MRPLLIFTIFLLLQLSSVHAQHIRYSPPETGIKTFASYEIIGKVGGHMLIYISGEDHAEIGVFDDDMKKLGAVPADFLKKNSSQSDFFTYPDHFFLTFQYHTGSTYYCAMIKSDENGKVLEGPVILDSTVLMPVAYKGPDLPMFIVLRSENTQWFMTIKGVPSDNDDQKLEATLYDKDFEPLKRTRFTYSNLKVPGEFSEFILDNDGDLAFIHSLKSDEKVSRVLLATLFFKPHDQDTLIMTALSTPGAQLDDLKIQIDNANHRYLFNSLYYKTSSPDLTGLCTMIWDKRSMGLTSKTLAPLSPQISADARSDFSPPEQVLNYYFLRQVFPYADGGFMVLAELCHGFERSNSPDFVRTDYIAGKIAYLRSPENLPIRYEPKVKPGYWLYSSRNINTLDGMSSWGRTTERILAFIMDPDGKIRDAKVVPMKGNTGTWLYMVSYQPFILGKAIHIMYNERVKARYVPVEIPILGDGTMGTETILHNLNSEYVFFPRYGKQVGPNTAIIPCQAGDLLCFARVDF